MSNLKEMLQKKSLAEIEGLIFDHKKKIEAEKDLITLGRLNSELNIMHEIRDQKSKESGRMIRKNTSSQDKPELKSYDDYVKSKKK